MFCPACGDCRGKIDLVNGKLSHFRCPICGHVFSYKPLFRIQKKLGPGNGFFHGEDNVLEPKYKEEE